MSNQYKLEYQELTNALGSDIVFADEPLSKHSTVGIGGPADIFCTPKTKDQLIKIIKLSREMHLPITMLGWGANTLISDLGIRGVVIRNMAKDISIIDNNKIHKQTNNRDLSGNFTQSRWEPFENEEVTKLYEFKDLDYDESKSDKITVIMDSGVDLPYAINYTISNKITGLQWYSRIPGTIGGSIFNNIHGGTHFISEVVNSVEIIDVNNNIVNLQKNDLNFDYDSSRFHTSREIILSVEFELFKGDAERAKHVAIEWAKRKAIQPSNSLGCVFKNLTADQKEQLGLPTTSFGYVIEHVLQMQGFRIGDAKISDKHKAFIENLGNATAKDYLAVIQSIQQKTIEKLGFKPELEIFLLGEGFENVN